MPCFEDITNLKHADLPDLPAPKRRHAQANLQFLTPLQYLFSLLVYLSPLKARDLRYPVFYHKLYPKHLENIKCGLRDSGWIWTQTVHFLLTSSSFA